MPKNTFAEQTQHWSHISTAARNNLEILPSHLGDQGEELEETLADARVLSNLQDVHAANLHQATKDLNAVMARGRELANRLRSGLRSSLGPRSEKLTEFGIRPSRRGRPPVATTPSVPVEPTPPPVIE